MRQTGWRLQLLVLLLALGTGGALQATVPGQTQWKLANFTWVKRLPAEPGAPANAHPAVLSQEALRAALGPVQAAVDGRDLPLFAQDELAALAKVLHEALTLAQPGEDVILLSTHKRGGSFMEMATGLTARLFVQDGALNLIVHDARLDFMNRYSADRTLPTFAYGSRQAASGANLQSPGATRLRVDWLALPLTPVAIFPAVPAAVPTAVILATNPAPRAVAPAPEPAASPRDAAFYEAQTQRLKALKRLRDESLLSEAEYQEKREAILKTL